MKRTRYVLIYLKNHGFYSTVFSLLHQLFEKLSNFCFLRALQINCKRKIAKIYSNLPDNNDLVRSEVIDQHKEMLGQLGKKVETKWIKTYTNLSGISSKNYIPEDIYYSIIEPRLNDYDRVGAFADKNLYHRLFTKFADYFPRTLLMNIDGYYYYPDYSPLNSESENIQDLLAGFTKVIVKPSIDSFGGRNVRLFADQGNNFFSANGKCLSFALLEKVYRRNFILQEYIFQHETFKKYNPSSLNTVRIYVYRSVRDEKIIPLHAVLRVGKPGSIVDNQSAGGFSVGINPDGVLNNFAIDKFGNKFSRIGAIDLSNPEKIDHFIMMNNLASTIAKEHFYARLLGFDITLDGESNIKIVEINSSSIEINFHQMNQGPLFKDYTEEIIGFCSSNL